MYVIRDIVHEQFINVDASSGGYYYLSDTPHIFRSVEDVTKYFNIWHRQNAYWRIGKLKFEETTFIP